MPRSRLLHALIAAAVVGTSLVALPQLAVAAPGDTVRLDRLADGTAVGGANEPIVLSGTGRYAAFVSNAATFLPPGQDANGVDDVFLVDRDADQNGVLDEYGTGGGVAVTPVSVTSTGSTGGAQSGIRPAVSDDGRFVAFASQATDLVPTVSGTPGWHVFVRDLVAGTTEQVDVAAPLGGSDAGSAVGRVDIDPSGRFVAFATSAPLVAADTDGGISDVYVRDLATDTTQLVSGGSGTGTDAGASSPSVVFDGSTLTLTVAFLSSATDLVDGITSYPLCARGPIGQPGVQRFTCPQVYVRSLPSGDTTLASVDSLGAPGTGHKSAPDLSAHGTRVAFASEGSLDPADDDGSFDVYLRDVTPGTTTWVSRYTDHSLVLQPYEGGSYDASISADGQRVAFTSGRPDLVPGDTNGVPDVFVWDAATNALQLASVGPGGVQGDSDSAGPSLSGDGRYVGFMSQATNLETAADPNPSGRDVFVHELPPAVTIDAAVYGPDPAAPTATVPAGGAAVDLRDIPIESIPLASVPLASVPLASVDLGSTPLASVPLASVPLASVPLASVPLASVPLASVPLASVSWDDLLANTSLAGVPLQSLTLQDVYDDPTARQRFEALDLSEVDLSATPLASVSFASVALGSTPLASVPIGSSPDPLTDWRALLTQLGYSNLMIGGDTTLMSLDLAGVPLASVPLASVPLASVPLASVPLASVPLASVELSATPLASVPLASVPLASVATLVDCTAVDCTSRHPRRRGRAGRDPVDRDRRRPRRGATGRGDADARRRAARDPPAQRLPVGAAPARRHGRRAVRGDGSALRRRLLGDDERRVGGADDRDGAPAGRVPRHAGPGDAADDRHRQHAGHVLVDPGDRHRGPDRRNAHLRPRRPRHAQHALVLACVQPGAVPPAPDHGDRRHRPRGLHRRDHGGSSRHRRRELRGRQRRPRQRARPRARRAVPVAHRHGRTTSTTTGSRYPRRGRGCRSS